MSKVRRILVLGATSAIAQAYARRCAAEGASFILLGRREDRLAAVAADLVARGARSVETFVGDLSALDEIQHMARTVQARFGPSDEVVIAFGILGHQARSEQDLAAARSVFENNLVSPALWTLALLKDRPSDRPLTLVAIGSAAGDRGRASNFVYGAAKGGLHRFFEGLAQKYDRTSVRILIVKPGLVDSPMTASIPKSGLLWATPDQVAASIYRAVTKGTRVVYAPWFWWPIMIIIRHLPWFVFKRLKI